MSMTPVVPHGSLSAFGRGNGRKAIGDLARRGDDMPDGERSLTRFEFDHQPVLPLRPSMVTRPRLVTCGDPWVNA
jgi:hypothetical protein